MVPKLNFPVIDVRDVALAHLRAMIIPEAVGHRHILVRDNIWMKDMAQVCPIFIDPYFLLLLVIQSLNILHLITVCYYSCLPASNVNWHVWHNTLHFRHYQKNSSLKATRCRPFLPLMLESRSYHTSTKLLKWLPRC